MNMKRSRQLGTARPARVSALLDGVDAQTYVLMMSVREAEIETEPVQTHKIQTLTQKKMQTQSSIDSFRKSESNRGKDSDT